MFQLGVLLFLSLSVSLSSGQDVTLSESSSSSGTCNITSCSCHWDSGGARVSCDVNTCFEAFNGSGNCFSSDSEFTCSQKSQENGSSFSSFGLCHVFSLFPQSVYSEPYPCQEQPECRACPMEDNVCLCRSLNYEDSDTLLVPLLVGFVLVLFFLPIVIFFNCNLASGPNHSFVFFYQCVPLASVYGFFSAVLVMQNYFLTDQPGIIFLEYFKYIVVLVVIFLIFFLVKCTWCPLQRCRLPWAKVRRAVRNFREKHIGSTFIHAICSIIVLSYGDLVVISVRVGLGTVRIKPNCCYHVDGLAHVSYNRSFHCNESFMVYFDRIFYTMSLSAIFSAGIAIFLLLLPLSLIYYPSIPALFHKLTGRSLPRFPKLDPVFDVFQGVYKEKMRWFAGVHLLYRMILWVVYLYHSDVIPFLFVVILAIHSLLQPFKNPKHNYVETLYLVCLVLQSLISSFLKNMTSANARECFNQRSNLFAVGIILIVCLSSLPTLLVLVYYSYNKLLSKCRCCQRCAAKIKNCHGKNEEEEEAQPIEVQQEEDHPYYVAEWL